MDVFGGSSKKPHLLAKLQVTVIQAKLKDGRWVALVVQVLVQQQVSLKYLRAGCALTKRN